MICFVDQSGQPGGAELCLADIARHYGKRSRVVLFADGPFAAQLKGEGIEVDVHPLPGAAAQVTKKSSPLSLASSAGPLLSHIAALRDKFRGAEAIYLNTAKALIHGVAANMWKKHPSVLHLHDIWDGGHFSSLNIRLLVLAANQTHMVIANSQATADAFRRVGGKTPVQVIPNGFDPAHFGAISSETIAAIRSEFNPEGLPVAAIFGRISRWKNQELLIRAAARLPGLAVWIVGEAVFTGDDHAYAEELRTIVREAGLENRVRFLGFRQDVAALMCAADIIVHCSSAPEPFGRVVVEGMLAERPVIAANAGGPKEIIEAGVTGFLTEPGDLEDLSGALEKLLESPAQRNQMGRAAKESAIRRYSLTRVLEQTDEVLQEVIRKS